jgi:hypothetical protein
MGIIKNMADGLVNIVANLGTGRDKAAHNHYVVTPWTPQQLEAIYRTSWLARAIIDYPAEDATRKWRQWRAEAKQITKLERLEKKLHLKRRVQDAKTAARLFGGAAIYLNTKTAKQELPLQVGKEEIRSLVVLTRNSLSPDPVVLNINSDYYGRPEFYRLTSGANASQVVIHASRLVIFQGHGTGHGPYPGRQGKGDAVLRQRLQRAVRGQPDGSDQPRARSPVPRRGARRHAVGHRQEVLWRCQQVPRDLRGQQAHAEPPRQDLPRPETAHPGAVTGFAFAKTAFGRFFVGLSTCR